LFLKNYLGSILNTSNQRGIIFLKLLEKKKLVLIYKQDGPKVFLLLEKVD